MMNQEERDYYKATLGVDDAALDKMLAKLEEVKSGGLSFFDALDGLMEIASLGGLDESPAAPFAILKFADSATRQ